MSVYDEIRKAGLRLILDFIPNHFNAESNLTKSNPELFLQGTPANHDADSHTFFLQHNTFLAHGKDPYFPAWTDTAQVNYFSPGTHIFMADKLLQIAKFCDGVRCDMAMLILPEIFDRTWGHLKTDDQETPNFWRNAIPRVKAKYPDFIFIAEAYWDMQWNLQQMGFDYTYDKKLLDRLVEGNVHKIKAHLKADLDYQSKMLRMIEKPR